MTCHSASGASCWRTNSSSAVRSDTYTGSDASTVNRCVGGVGGRGATLIASHVNSRAKRAIRRSRRVIDVPRFVGDDGLGVAFGRQFVNAAEQVLEPIVRVAGGVL